MLVFRSVRARLLALMTLIVIPVAILSVILASTTYRSVIRSIEAAQLQTTSNFAVRARVWFRGALRTVIVANPADRAHEAAALSPMAPWLAVQKRAALLLTEPDGKNVNALVEAAVRQPALERIDNVILLANLQAIPMEQRPNPIPGTKAPVIEMEQLTPAGMEPFSFAVGRLFNEDPGIVVSVLARER